jgi:hypothetical protein
MTILDEMVEAGGKYADKSEAPEATLSGIVCTKKERVFLNRVLKLMRKTAGEFTNDELLNVAALTQLRETLR